MRFIIIGYGYLGSEISNYNLKKNYKTIIFRSNSIKKPQIVNKEKNIFKYDKSVFKKTLKKNDLVLFTSSPNEQDLKKISNQKKNKFIIFFKEILEMCSNKKISQFIFFSSIKVYGNISKIYENTSTKPISDYSKLKLDCENKIKEISKNSNIQFKILRISNVFGVPKNYNQNYDNLIIPSLVKSILNNKIIILKNSMIKKDFISTRNFVKKLNKILKHKPLNDFTIYNLGSYKAVSLLHISRILKKIVYLEYNITTKILSTNHHKSNLSFNSNFKFLNIKFNEKEFSTNLRKILIFYKKHLNE